MIGTDRELIKVVLGCHLEFIVNTVSILVVAMVQHVNTQLVMCLTGNFVDVVISCKTNP